VRYPSPKIFTLLFGPLYVICFYVDIALFRYYPETAEFHWRMTENAGPAILWYGWLAVAALASAAIAILVPPPWADRLWSGWVWLGPTIAVVVILLYETRWFV
jgi:hypothetical protein